MAKIIPVTRSGVVAHSARYFESLGAPVERLLQQAGIPAQILDIPDAVVRLQSAYRFAELACQKLHSEHLGLYFGLASSLDDFGSYGTNLKCSYTIGDYLKKGVDSYSSLTTGERLPIGASPTRSYLVRVDCAALCNGWITRINPLSRSRRISVTPMPQIFPVPSVAVPVCLPVIFAMV